MKSISILVLFWLIFSFVGFADKKQIDDKELNKGMQCRVQKDVGGDGHIIELTFRKGIRFPESSGISVTIYDENKRLVYEGLQLLQKTKNGLHCDFSVKSKLVENTKLTFEYSLNGVLWRTAKIIFSKGKNNENIINYQMLTYTL